MRKTKLKFTKKERVALRLAKQDPEASDHEIGKQMVKLGEAQSPVYVNNRVSRSERFADEIAILRESALAKLMREAVPKALDINTQVLNSDKISRKDKFVWVKMTLDKAIGYDETKTKLIPQTVHIDQIQVLMQNIQSEALKKIKENNKLEGE